MSFFRNEYLNIDLLNSDMVCTTVTMMSLVNFSCLQQGEHDVGAFLFVCVSLYVCVSVCVCVYSAVTMMSLMNFACLQHGEHHVGAFKK